MSEVRPHGHVLEHICILFHELLGANIRSFAISHLYRNIPSADLLDLNRRVTSGEVEGVKAQGGQGGGGPTRNSIGYLYNTSTYGYLATFPRILQASGRVIAEG